MRTNLTQSHKSSLLFIYFLLGSSIFGQAQSTSPQLEQLDKELENYQNIQLLWNQLNDLRNIFSNPASDAIREGVSPVFIDDADECYKAFVSNFTPIIDTLNHLNEQADHLHEIIEQQGINKSTRQALKKLLHDIRRFKRAERRAEHKTLKVFSKVIKKHLNTSTLGSDIGRYLENMESEFQHIWLNLSVAIKNFEAANKTLKLAKDSLQTTKHELLQHKHERDSIKLLAQHYQSEALKSKIALKELEVKNSSSQQKQQRLTTQIEATQSEKDSLEQTIEDLRLLQQNFSNRLNRVNQEIEKKQQESNGLQDNLSELNIKVKQQEQELEDREQELEDREQERHILFIATTLLLLFILIIVIYFWQRLGNEKRLVDNKLIEANEKLKILFKELQHRTKNNLQQVSSMIDMQRNTTTDPYLKKELTETQSRIRTVSGIYALLYKDDFQTQINMKQYLRQLLYGLRNAIQTQHQDVELNLDQVEPIPINTDMAIPVGLIVNELATNAFKYAFTTNHPAPILSITLRKLPNEYIQLTIKDNGKGFPKTLNPHQAESMGLQLVNILTQQINGTPPTFTNHQGAAVTLSFPNK